METLKKLKKKKKKKKKTQHGICPEHPAKEIYAVIYKNMIY